jgi:hypothetical protein
MTDSLVKKFPLLALIFLVLITVYATKYRSISGFNTASVPDDIQVQNYISKIIAPVTQAINNSANIYTNTSAPPIFRSIIQSVSSSYESIMISLNKLNTPSITSTKNTVYILPLLFREAAISIQNTANIIIKNPAILSERSLNSQFTS